MYQSLLIMCLQLQTKHRCKIGPDLNRDQLYRGKIIGTMIAAASAPIFRWTRLETHLERQKEETLDGSRLTRDFSRSNIDSKIRLQGAS